MGRRRSDDALASWVALALLAIVVLIAKYPLTTIAIALLFAALWLALRSYERHKALPTYDMNEIDNMSGPEFEEYVCRLFQALGYRSQVTQKSRDFGVDVICERKKDKIAIQAKRYASNVNLKCVQEVTAGMRKYGCNKSMVVTNSYFAQSAIELASHNNCELVDRDKLIRLIHKSASLAAAPEKDIYNELLDMPLTGDELLRKIRSLPDSDKRDMVRTCGYSMLDSDGNEKLDFEGFYDALVEARNAEALQAHINDMRVVVKCPKCVKSLGLPKGRSGTVRCPACGSSFDIET